MIVLGLTGSIGMGKSTTAEFFKQAGVPVYSADDAVHELYNEAFVTAKIELAFPKTVENGVVNRQKLMSYIMGNQQNLKKLEEMIHPLVRQKERNFIASAKAQGEKLVVLDIPLLFETNGEHRVDKIVVVSAPSDIQKKRVMARDGMSEEKFQAILLRQVSDDEKRAKADFIIDTGNGLLKTKQQVDELLAHFKAPRI